MSPSRVLAFDLGGTRLKAGLVVAGQERVERRWTGPTPPAAEDALRLLEEVARGIVGEDGLDAVGLCVPGLIGADGRVFALPGKLDGIVGLDLAGHLRAAFACAAVVVNDAIAYGLGEVSFGAGRGQERVVVVTIGTGVGVGVFEGGRPLGRGPYGGGLLGGQIPVWDDPHGPADTNGRQGTIEARCAAARILAAAQRHGSRAADVASVYAAAEAGEAASRSGIADYQADLARGLVALAHAHAPSRIVLGGGPMGAGNPCLRGLEEQVNVALWPGYRVEICAATLGDDAALLGVAALAADAR